MMTELLTCVERELTDEEAAGVAIALADVITQATAALEKLKTRLRASAAETSLEGKVVTIKGSDLEGRLVGDVTVTFPRAQATLNKDFNPAKVRRVLGDAVFDLYFEMKPSLRKGALEKLRERRENPSIGEDEFNTMFSAVDIAEPTARVGFRPIPQGLLNARYR